jgi:hypothetical protein
MRHFITAGFTFGRLSTFAKGLRAAPFLRVLVALVLLVISVELGGIWSELKGIRQEQVKNAAYTLRPEQLSRLPATAAGQQRLRALAGQSAVTLDPSEPLSVKIDDSVLDPIYVQAGDALPVEIQR